jgi:hypothetical protein
MVWLSNFFHEAFTAAAPLGLAAFAMLVIVALVAIIVAISKGSRALVGIIAIIAVVGIGDTKFQNSSKVTQSIILPLKTMTIEYSHRGGGVVSLGLCCIGHFRFAARLAISAFLSS